MTHLGKDHEVLAHGRHEKAAEVVHEWPGM